MNVKELIDELQKLPQDKEVRIIAEEFSEYSAQSCVKKVVYEKEFDKVFISGWEHNYL
jgi:hypothetical protein